MDMRGYSVSSGYMGWVGSGYRLFVSESEYYEYMED